MAFDRIDYSSLKVVFLGIGERPNKQKRRGRRVLSVHLVSVRTDALLAQLVLF